MRVAWCCPGGKRLLGELPLEAAYRETQEEVGIDVRAYPCVATVYDGIGMIAFVHTPVHRECDGLGSPQRIVAKGYRGKAKK